MERTIELPGPDATAAAAAALAPRLGAGDTVGLSGPLGAGKTAFARALIGARLAALGRREEVPSPTYTLVQVYDLGPVELWHADLYRLGDASELEELGLTEAFSRAIVLIEWPERLGSRRPEDLLLLELGFGAGAETARSLRIAASDMRWSATIDALCGPYSGQ